MKTIIYTLLFCFFNSFADNIYVDQTLGGNITDGGYSIVNRNDSGSDGDAYTTIQAAINAVSVGDVIYMRGGTYNISTHGTSYASGYYIRIDPSTKSGTAWTAGNFYTLNSYTEEWAIIDAEQNVSNSYPVRGAIGYGQSTTSDNSDLAYWLFERFEVKNAQSQDGTRGAAFGLNGGPIKYRYLSIHDNYATTGGNNPAGIRMEHMHDTLIEYCYFYNNGTNLTGYDKNSADIVTITDYSYNATTAASGFTESSSHVASRRNIVRYNYFGGGSIGFKYKGNQLLSIRDGGYDSILEDEGDKVYNNIFQDYAYGGIIIRVDFAQVYNNIVDGGAWGIMAGYYECSVPIYNICVYNNTIMEIASTGPADANGAISRKMDTGYGYSNELNIVGYDYNNIIDDCDAGRNGSNSLSVGCISETDVVLTGYYNSNNYFYRPVQSDIMYLKSSGGQGDNDYTLSEFESQSETHTPRDGYENNYDAGDLLYLGTTGADKYKVYDDHIVDGSTTIADGGINVSHPFLDGVSIPAYIGGVNPFNSEWIDDVLDLVNLPDLASGGQQQGTIIIGGSGEIEYSGTGQIEN